MEKNILVFDLSTEGLDPKKHRIIGITTKTKSEERVFAYTDEAQILQEFWNYIKYNKFNRIVGFNSHAFDVPVIILRSIKHSVQTQDIKHISVDLRELTVGNFGKGKLSDFQVMLDIEFPESRYKKMHMSILWAVPGLQELKDFLLRDVKITWELYNYIAEGGIRV